MVISSESPRLFKNLNTTEISKVSVYLVRLGRFLKILVITFFISGCFPTESPSVEGKKEENADNLVLNAEYLLSIVLNVWTRYSATIPIEAEKGSTFLRWQNLLNSCMGPHTAFWFHHSMHP